MWAADEYEKLRTYDLPMPEQPLAVFKCHQGDNQVCSGWLGAGDPLDLLAVRLGIAEGRLDPACSEYSTDVDLWPTGDAAANHGLRDIAEPNTAARAAMDKIARVRAARRMPIILD